MARQLHLARSLDDQARKVLCALAGMGRRLGPRAHCDMQILLLVCHRMIRHFEPPTRLAPEEGGHLQLVAALGAGLIPGIILLIVPRGTPWAPLTFFSPAVMGRPLPVGVEMPLPAVWALHLAVSVVYGLLISWAVGGLVQLRAVAAGGLIGIVLYWLNLAVVSWCWPVWRANEVAVLFTHVVFGLICAGAYRGLLRRKVPVQAPNG